MKILCVSWSFHELDLVDFPFFCCKSSLDMARKSLTWLRVSSILEVVVTDWELSIWLLDVRTIHDADITATKDGSFVWIAGNCKLSQIQVKFLPQVKGKDKRWHWLICCPVLFAGVPGQRSVPTDDLSILSFNNSDGLSDSIASFVELQSWEVVFAGSVEEIEGLDLIFGEEWSDVVMLLGDFAVESKNVIHSKGRSGICRKRHKLFFGLNHVEIFDPLQRLLNGLHSFFALLGWEISFYNFFFVHEEIGENLVHVDSANIVVVMFVDHVDKIHGFLVEPK